MTATPNPNDAAAPRALSTGLFEIENDFRLRSKISDTDDKDFDESDILGSLQRRSAPSKWKVISFSRLLVLTAWGASPLVVATTAGRPSHISVVSPSVYVGRPRQSIGDVSTRRKAAVVDK